MCIALAFGVSCSARSDKKERENEDLRVELNLSEADTMAYEANMQKMYNRRLAVVAGFIPVGAMAVGPVMCHGSSMAILGGILCSSSVMMWAMVQSDKKIISQNRQILNKHLSNQGAGPIERM